MTTLFTLGIFIGIALVIGCMRVQILNRYVKYGILLFVLSLSSAIASTTGAQFITIVCLCGAITSIFLFIWGIEDPRYFARNQIPPSRLKITGYTFLSFSVSILLFYISMQTSPDPSGYEQTITRSPTKQTIVKLSQQTPEKNSNKTLDEKSNITAIDTETSKVKFDWDAFDASPERAKLSDDVRDIQNNKLKGAHFIPVANGTESLENFMRKHNLKFTIASLDCFSSDTHCSLTVAITRSEYPSKANGDFCGPMARWTAPYTNIKQWTSDGNSPLVQMLDAGDSNAVLNKIDYEYQRRCF